uniref:Uncharacterized protein n=1 Tax=Myotis myotis TaxID=51298 RepID=A0A7J7U5J1_MYOMY|nr:hypothetical protein mMyoMyo1_008866 [Myotis myotis]
MGRKSSPEPGRSALRLSDYPSQDSGSFICLPVSASLSILSFLSLSLSLIPSLSQIISWGLCLRAPTPPCVGNLTFIICFLYFGNVHLTSYLRGVGVEEQAAWLHPFPCPLLSESDPSPSFLPPELSAEAFPALGHCGIRNQVLIHDLPSTAHRRVGKAVRPLLIHCCFADLGKRKNSRHRESPVETKMESNVISASRQHYSQLGCLTCHHRCLFNVIVNTSNRLHILRVCPVPGTLYNFAYHPLNSFIW